MWSNIHSTPSVGLSQTVCLLIGLSVCLQLVLWQNGWVDPNAIGMVSGVGLAIGALDFGGGRRRGRCRLGWNPLSGFQVPIDFKGTQTTGRNKCFAITSCHFARWLHLSMVLWLLYKSLPEVSISQLRESYRILTGFTKYGWRVLPKYTIT